eukprot:37075-Amphidinium_carterae.1
MAKEPKEGDWCRVRVILDSDHTGVRSWRRSTTGSAREHLRCSATTASEGSQLGRAQWRFLKERASTTP